jgi:hypothetical protein
VSAEAEKIEKKQNIEHNIQTLENSKHKSQNHNKSAPSKAKKRSLIDYLTWAYWT